MAEAFSLSFDVSKELIGKEEFTLDETLIVELTELPRIWEKLFKTTITKDVEFRSYLNPEHRGMVWKKSVSSSWLEDRWQQLLKAIVVYITCEGRYNMAMIYHFKLMNHFTGKIPLNLPFYLHKILAKMSHQVKAQPIEDCWKIVSPWYYPTLDPRSAEKEKYGMGTFLVLEWF